MELVSEFKPMAEMLVEEGIDQLVQPFYKRAIDTLHNPQWEEQPGWQAWEGYYVDQEDGTQNLYVVGVLQRQGIFYSRCMRVKHVPKVQQTEVEKALAEMMQEYLDGLFKEIERTIFPGSGKTDQFPSGLN